MGQIVGGAAKPKRCNINQLSQLGTPAAGEHILVSSDNSMNAAGQGNFDCYIMGDGTTAATELEQKKIVEMDTTPNSASSKPVTSKGIKKYVDDNLKNIVRDVQEDGLFVVDTNGKVVCKINQEGFHSTNMDVKNVNEQGFFFTDSGGNIIIKIDKKGITGLGLLTGKIVED